MNVNKNRSWRKANYAVIVKNIMPHSFHQLIWHILNLLTIKTILFNISINFSVDTICYYGIIIFTLNTLIIGDDYGRLHGCQNQNFKRVWSIKLTAETRSRQIIREKRIFRPSRYGTGQIRDASPCKGRWLVGYTGGQNIWVLTGCILSGKDRLRAIWNTRSDYQTPRSKTRSQAFRCRFELYRSAAFSRQSHSCCDACYYDSKTVQAFPPPSQYRTGIDSPAKKRAINIIGDGEWTSRYEQLRHQATQGCLTGQGGYGLTLFMRQGMVAWMHAWPKPHTTNTNITKHQIFNATENLLELPQSLRTQITIVLADMILNQSHQEAKL